MSSALYKNSVGSRSAQLKSRFGSWSARVKPQFGSEDNQLQNLYWFKINRD